MDVEQEIIALKQTVSALQKQGSGSTYVRWGRKTCPSWTTLLYLGYTGGNHYTNTGGPANHLCLPENPTWASYVDGEQAHLSTIYGTEYENPSGTFNPFNKQFVDEDAPCAVCKTNRTATIMIPARTNCFSVPLTVGMLVLAVIQSTGALNCYNCPDISDPQNCNNTVTCPAGEGCFVQRFMRPNHQQYYKMGCMESRSCSVDSFTLFTTLPFGKKRDHADSEVTSYRHNDKTDVTSHRYNKRNGDDLFLCQQCCNDADRCNKNLCGTAPTAERQCLDCDDVLSWKDCQQTTFCSENEVCYVQSTINNIVHQIRVNMGCMGQLQCEGIKKAFPQRCMVCCDDADFCNYNACDNFTTTTTTVATTPAATNVIKLSGPSSVSYGNSAELSCFTLPPATHYKWLFQNSPVLPPGFSSPNHTIVNGGLAGISVLTVSAVNENTIGVYTCSGTYQDGRTSSSSFLLKPEPLKPIVNIQKSPVANNFVLVCNVTGYPAPSVSWNYNGVALQQALTSGYDTVHTGTVYTLVVYHYDPRQDGTWSCDAVNSGGKTTAQIHIP